MAQPIFGGDFFIFVSLFSIELLFISFIIKKFSLIHIVIIIEIIIISTSILAPANASILSNFPDGEIFALFAIAIAAAETALILSIYIFVRRKNYI
jgi:NADH:ubiquinone oxidoreductase subunit K